MVLLFSLLLLSELEPGEPHELAEPVADAVLEHVRVDRQALRAHKQAIVRLARRRRARVYLARVERLRLRDDFIDRDTALQRRIGAVAAASTQANQLLQLCVAEADLVTDCMVDHGLAILQELLRVEADAYVATMSHARLAALLVDIRRLIDRPLDGQTVLRRLASGLSAGAQQLSSRVHVREVRAEH